MNLFKIIRDSITKIEKFWNWCGTVFEGGESQSSKPGEDVEQAPRKQTTANQENRRTSFEPSMVNPKQACKEEKYSIHWWKDRLEVAGIVFGIIVAFLLFFQWREMVKTTDVAMGQLKAMQGQLKEMQETRILDERAWVGPIDVKEERPAGNTNLVIFKMELKNTGKSPALNVSVTHGLTFAINGIKRNLEPGTNSMILAPAGSTFILTETVPDKMVERAKSGQWQIYIFGRIKYDDIFRNHHWTSFCWVSGMGDSALSWRPAEIGNSCDELDGN